MLVATNRLQDALTRLSGLHYERRLIAALRDARHRGPQGQPCTATAADHQIEVGDEIELNHYARRHPSPERMNRFHCGPSFKSSNLELSKVGVFLASENRVLEVWMSVGVLTALILQRSFSSNANPRVDTKLRRMLLFTWLIGLVILIDGFHLLAEVFADVAQRRAYLLISHVGVAKLVVANYAGDSLRQNIRVS
jgi:hypothetical protein